MRLVRFWGVKLPTFTFIIYYNPFRFCNAMEKNYENFYFSAAHSIS